VSVTVLESRLRSGRIVRIDDVERAAMGLFKPQNLQLLRELLLRTVDQLTVPVISPAKTSTALAIVTGAPDPKPYLRRIGALAEALDLALEVTFMDRVPDADLADAVRAGDGVLIPVPPHLSKGDLTDVRAAFVSVPMGEMASKILARPLDRDLYIVDPARLPLTRGAGGARHPYGQTAGDRLRIGYGRLTIYLGSIAGSGKTYAMLDRAHALIEEGLDVVAALIETHGRADTAAKAAGIEVLPRLPTGELGRDAVLRRRPGVVLIDELAHTNAPGSTYPKRYDDVINILRDGISVMTTLNVQHLEGLGDAVQRLTGMHVRETLPDTILELADDVIFIDVTPDVLRERLRQGKIYPPERIDAALSNFFKAENLAALRELTVRELMHARGERRAAPPFSRIILGVAARERDVGLIERLARLAARLDIDLLVLHVALPGKEPPVPLLETLGKATRAAKGKWRLEVNSDPAAALVAATGDLDVLVVESPRSKHRMFGPVSFAVKVIRAGIRELLVVAPR
jgi:two-component system sensor histidine kinase KdpD